MEVQFCSDHKYTQKIVTFIKLVTTDAVLTCADICNDLKARERYFDRMWIGMDPRHSVNYKSHPVAYRSLTHDYMLPVYSAKSDFQYCCLHSLDNSF